MKGMTHRRDAETPRVQASKQESEEGDRNLLKRLRACPSPLPTFPLRLGVSAVKFLLVIFLFSQIIFAQDEEPPTDAAPPPVRTISKDEKKQLETETNIKKRTQMSLDLMELRLKKAEEFSAQNQFQDSLNELGSFHALLENALKHLNKNDNGSSKIDYNFKRLEIGLRRTVSRLELIFREMPFRYGYYVRKLQKFVRETRAKAIEPLFDDTVVPERRL